MKNNKTILYVEDNDLIREEAVEYLSLIYTNVLEASNGEEALIIYKEKKPDIIIADIEMPIISGLEMIRHIRRKDRKTPIIIVTAFMDNEYLLEAIELQLIKYILKPLTNYKLDVALELAQVYLQDEEKRCVIQLTEDSYYDQLNKVLTINQKIIDLTHNEILLLSLLTKNPNQIITYSEIKNKIWNYEENYIDSLRSLIRSLRRKVKNTNINNISGVGYRLVVD